MIPVCRGMNRAAARRLMNRSDVRWLQANEISWPYRKAAVERYIRAQQAITEQPKPKESE